MGCVSCGKKTTSSSYYDISVYDIIWPPNKVRCTKTLGEIKILQDRLNCAKDKISFKYYNSYSGIIKSMLNFKDYCRYDVAPILDMIENHEC